MIEGTHPSDMSEDAHPWEVVSPEMRRILDELPFPFVLVGAYPDHGVVLSNVGIEEQKFLSEILDEHFTNEAYPLHQRN